MFARRTAALAAAGLFALVLGGMAGAEDAPLDIKIPKPAYIGTKKDLPPGLGRVEKLTEKPRSPFLAPKGCRNLAIKRPVTSSDAAPIIGKLEQVTDGDKEGTEGSWVELAPGAQWVQIDLGQQAQIYAIVVWHYHGEPRVYKGVVVQVSSDADFINNVQTVFNNDQDNAVGLGLGDDLQYFEHCEGKLMNTKGVKGRYVRLWSRGNTTDDQNHYTEDAPLEIKIPKPGHGPINPPHEIPMPTGKLRPLFVPPKGCKNLALNRPVTSSDPEPIIGKIKQVTDGDKDGVEGSWVELGPGRQWVQIDLGATAQIYAIVVWHHYVEPRVYMGVVVQVSDDPAATKTHIVFNNDQDNAIGLGIGDNLQYYESREGKLIETKGVKGRYVRLWSRGNTTDDQNHYTEVEVWGLPVTK